MPKAQPRLFNRLLLALLCIASLISVLSLSHRFTLRVRSAAATITVNTTADDDTINGNCTLREAIQAANSDTAVDACAAGAGTDTIAFAIPGVGPHTIAPSSPLPQLTAPVIIDGTTQAGASCTAAGGLKIELNGAGLYITGGNSTVKGLVINRSPGQGILLTTNGGNTISCNYIGTDVTGTLDLGNASEGIAIGTPNNVIGGTAAGAGNLISGNDANGVLVESATATGNLLQGNLIGTNVSGASALANRGSGVLLRSSAHGNTVGGTTSGARNVISGNTLGILVETNNNNIQGNYIGTDVTGTADVGNSLSGLELGNFTTNNLVGGATASARNVVSGNDNAGIYVNQANSNTVQNNYVGTNAAGTAMLGNNGDGIAVIFGANNILGGTGVGNLLSGNGGAGLKLLGAGATGNQVRGNFVGTNAAGTAALSVSVGMLLIEGAANNQIGGPGAGEGNVISGNPGYGLALGNAPNNTIQGNLIGTNAAGTAALGNGGEGVVLDNSPNSLIGGTAAGARNLISGNNQHGISIGGAAATGNQIQGNYIGTNAAGAADLGNNGLGIFLSGGASNNLIGGPSVAARNLVSGNDVYGIYINNSNGNTVQNNYVGTDVTGTLNLGNQDVGLAVDDAANNQIGGAGAGNLISGNGGNGFQIRNVLSTGNQVQGNYIGTDVTGTLDLGNGGLGIYVESASNNTIGGTSAGARNLISGNNSGGVHLRFSQSTNITVQGNYIGANAAGTTAIGNSGHGILVEGAPNNLIGGAATGARNLISGNTGFGVFITAGATGCQVLGNYIGVNANGDAALGNGDSGIGITANNSIIGGIAPGAGNVVSANRSGIVIGGTTTTGTQILGNFVGTNAAGTAALGNLEIGVSFDGDNTIIGGTTSGARNVISGNGGVGIQGGGNNVTIQGNYIGTDITGTVALPHAREGIFYTGSNGLIGGLTAAARNLISGNNGSGIGLGFTATNNQVQGNYIGTNAAGTAAVSNGSGIAIVEGASGNFIGGTTAGARNVISGNTGTGVTFYIRGNNNTVQGNFIGVNATGAGALPNGVNGVHAIISSGNTIGGTAAGAANRIAYNGQSGVVITDDSGNPSINNRILANEIFANGLFGIDLGAFGVNANDAGDGDSGPNNLQNFPVLNPIGTAGMVSGALDSTVANSAYPVRLEFFANAACDTAGHGEGEVFLGAMPLNAPGGFTFGYVPVAGKPFITATATDANGNTSEFSGCRAPNQPPSIFPTSNIAVSQGGHPSFATLAGVSDPDMPNETLTYKVNDASSATVNGVTVSLISLPPPMNILFQGTVAAGCTATAASFTLSVTDSVGHTATGTLNIAVNPNTAPTGFSYNAPAPLNQGGSTTVNVASTPTDNGIFTYGLQGVTGTSTFTGNVSVNPVNGMVTISNASPAGTYNVTIRAQDVCGLSSTATIQLTVNCGTPSLSYSPSLTVNQGGSATVNPVTSSGASIHIVQSVTGASPFTGSAGANITTGAVSISNAGPVGTYTVTVRAFNGCGQFTDATFSLTVSCPSITISPTISSPLPFAFTGNVYTLSLSASGGTAPYTFSHSGGTLPPGLAPQFISNVWRLTGTPTAQGVYNFTLQAAAANGCTGARSYTLIVYGNTPTLTVTTTADEDGSNPAACSLREAITAANTNAAYGGCGAGQVGYDVIKFALPAAAAYTIAPGPLPLPYLTEPVFIDGRTGDALFPRVELSGASATQNPSPGEFPNGLSFRSHLCYAKSLVINRFNREGAGIELKGSDLSAVEDCYLGTNASGNAVLGNNLGVHLTNGSDSNRIGGIGTNQPNLISGNLYNGVLLNSSISNTIRGNKLGTNLAGTAGLSNGDAGIAVFNTGNLAANTVSSNVIAYNRIGVVVSDSLGTANRTRITSNQIFANTGLGIDLIPANPGDAGITANDAGDADEGPNRLQNFPVLNPITTPGTITGSINTLATSASYSLFVELYANSSCDSSGQGEGEQFLTGVVLANATAASNFSITYTPVPGKPFITALVFDASGNTSEFSACQSECPTISLPALPNGVVGLPYNQTVAANPTGYTYSYTLSGTLPTGLNFNNGVFSGTPVQTGSFSFTITASTNGGACSGSQMYTVQFTCPTLVLSDLPPAQSGQAYSQTITVMPGGGAYTFTLINGALPTGLTLNASGTLSGTPTQGGTYTFTIKATGFGGACMGTRTYTLTANCPTISLHPNTLPNGIAGTAYNQTLSATPANTTYSFAVTAGTLPPGLSLNANGTLNGTPTAAGNYAFTVAATGFGNCPGTRNYNLLVTGTCATMTLNPTSLPDGTLGTAYNQTFVAAPAGTYTYTVTNGALPNGLSLNSNTGVLSGTPSQTGNFSFRITATNTGGCTGFRQYLISIACAPLTFTPASLPAGRSGLQYSQSITASPGSNYTYSLLIGQLPSGYSLSNAGVLSGLTNQTGTFNFTVRAFAPGGCQGTKAYSLAIMAGAAAVHNDFDGDGRSDLLRWEAAAGRWQIGQSSDGKTQTLFFGAPGDVPVQADYDGDGKVDVAVYRPENGTWYILKSSLGPNQQALLKHWGLATDVPVPGDYDGDGKADMAVWRGNEGNWYIWRSSNDTYQIEAWGANAAPYNDLPVASDYDGDGKTDLAVFRRGQAEGQGAYWFIKLSRSGETLSKLWGLSGDTPVVADYDGDGQADLAVWRGQQSSGVWYILHSSDQSYLTKIWGSALPPILDVAAPGDYDGDGKTDIAVCRNANTWFIAQSSTNTALTKELIRP